MKITGLAWRGEFPGNDEIPVQDPEGAKNGFMLIFGFLYVV